MSLDIFEGGSSRSWAALRWGVAGVVVAVAHAGVGWWVVTHTGPTDEPPASVQGVTIDLEPVMARESAPSPRVAAFQGPAPEPEPPASTLPETRPEVLPPSALPALPALPPTSVAQTTEAEVTPVHPPPDLSAMTQAAEPPPVAELAPTADVHPVQPPAVTKEMQPAPLAESRRSEPPVADIPIPELPQQDTKSDAVLAQSPAASPERMQPRRAPVETPPDPRVLARQAAERKALSERRAQQRAERAEAQAQRRASAEAARERSGGGQALQTSAASSASSGASISTWRGEVVAHLNAFKPSAPGGASGTVHVAFSVDRSGRVVSVNLAGSSGDGALDQAALTMIRRASPVPAPPPELGTRVSLAVPVQFH